MNADQRLLQILDNSACLSKGQLLGYLKHTLYPEELRAVELHLSTCALCNDALEGMERQQDAEKLLASLTPPVLPAITPKEKKEPQPAALKPEKQAAGPARTQPIASAAESKPENSFRPRKLWVKPLGIAAALALGMAALWYFEFRDEGQPEQLALNREENAIPERGPADTGLRTAAASPVAAGPSIQKHEDSLLLARKQKEAAAKIAQADSTLPAAKISSQEADAPQGTLVAAETKESTAVADNIAARKAVAPVAMSAKEEAAEEPKEKEAPKPLTDYQAGMQKYKEKNYASALLYFKSAESDKDDPKHWEAVYYSAMCHKNLGKRRKAIRLFERVIDADVSLKGAAQRQLDDLRKK